MPIKAKQIKKIEINIRVKLITICVFCICDDKLYKIECKTCEEV